MKDPGRCRYTKVGFKRVEESPPEIASLFIQNPPDRIIESCRGSSRRDDRNTENDPEKGHKKYIDQVRKKVL